jgi:hypothetical protein
MFWMTLLPPIDKALIISQPMPRVVQLLIVVSVTSTSANLVKRIPISHESKSQSLIFALDDFKISRPNGGQMG